MSANRCLHCGSTLRDGECPSVKVIIENDHVMDIPLRSATIGQLLSVLKAKVNPHRILIRIQNESPKKLKKLRG